MGSVHCFLSIKSELLRHFSQNSEITKSYQYLSMKAFKMHGTTITKNEM